MKTTRDVVRAVGWFVRCPYCGTEKFVEERFVDKKCKKNGKLIDYITECFSCGKEFRCEEE